MALKVHRAGILSTLQDRGRYGYQRFGVPVGGVMDDYSHRLANLLVDNPEDEATLELTLAGPAWSSPKMRWLRFAEATWRRRRRAQRAGGAPGAVKPAACSISALAGSAAAPISRSAAASTCHE